MNKFLVRKNIFSTTYFTQGEMTHTAFINTGLSSFLVAPVHKSSTAVYIYCRSIGFEYTLWGGIIVLSHDSIFTRTHVVYICTYYCIYVHQIRCERKVLQIISTKNFCDFFITCGGLKWNQQNFFCLVAPDDYLYSKMAQIA